jgi:hypothetical protein
MTMIMMTMRNIIVLFKPELTAFNLDNNLPWSTCGATSIRILSKRIRWQSFDNNIILTHHPHLLEIVGQEQFHRHGPILLHPSSIPSLKCPPMRSLYFVNTIVIYAIHLMLGMPPCRTMTTVLLLLIKNAIANHLTSAVWSSLTKSSKIDLWRHVHPKSIGLVEKRKKGKNKQQQNWLLLLPKEINKKHSRWALSFRRRRRMRGYLFCCCWRKG